MSTPKRSTPIRQVRLAALATAVALVVPGATNAQNPIKRLDPVQVTAVSTVEANALSDRAIALYGTPKKFKQAAKLHVRAADMRSPTDARGFSDLNMAAHLFYAAGDLGRAEETMERAAEHAAARGDVFAAAKSFVYAGLFAIEERRPERVPELALKAELLASSPLITQAQRAEIMHQVGIAQAATSSQVVATVQR